MKQTQEGKLSLLKHAVKAANSHLTAGGGGSEIPQ